MKRSLSSRSFIKYLFSYSFCLILPIVVFSLLYKTIFLTGYTGQLIEKTAESMDFTFGYLDLKINSLNQMAFQILSSSELSDAAFQENPPILNYLVMARIFTNHININEYLFDIWCYNRRQKYFFSSTQMFSEDGFYTYGPKYPEVRLQDFLAELSPDFSRTWIPQTRVDIYGREYPLLTYVQAFPNSYTCSDSMLILQINDDFFGHSIKSMIQYDNSTSVVLDHEGRIIYAQNPAMKTISDLIISSIDLSPENSQPVRRAIHRVGREDYFLYLRTSEDKQLTYLSIIPYRQFARAVQKYTMIFFVMVIFIILIGSLLIFFLMKYNYEPLKKLVQYSRKYAGLPPEQHAGIHDIEIIRAALDEITDKNESLAHHIDRIMNFLDLQIEEAAAPSGGREGLKTEQRITVSHDSILKYIEENYQKKDFCVQSIADHFGLSFSNLSHQFKNYTGKNISSFISALKLNYAKKLLSTTSLPVSEIALRLGYSQASGFIRKFRQTEGISPGEYRNRKPDEALKD